MSSDLAVNLRNMRERLVPARLQFASDQPIGWIGGVVLPEGAVGGIARRFEIAMKGLAHLIAALARLLLRGSRGSDGAGADDGQQRVLDGVVNTQAAKGDAARLGIVHPAPAAAVARDLMLHARVSERQLASTAPATDKAGEQCVAMLGRSRLRLHKAMPYGEPAEGRRDDG